VLLYILTLSGWLGFRTLPAIATMGLAATLFVFFCYAVAASTSLRVKTARTAFVSSAGLVAFLLTIPPLLCAAGRPLRLAHHGSVWRELWLWFEALDPVTVLGAFDVGRRIAGDIPIRAADLVARFFAIYLPVSLLLPVEMVWRFRRIAIRA
jgi:hypothetical protein